MVCRRHLVILSIVLATAELGTLPRVRAQTSLQTRDVVNATASQTSPELKHGAYYALVIGINGYSPFPQLQTPVNDAKEIAGVLSDQYGFTTHTLLDREATRDHIIEAPDRYRSSLKENDNLLIYYAGHGYYDKKAVLSISDSCCSWILRDTNPNFTPDDHAKYVVKIRGKRSRPLMSMSSGGNEPVLDSDGSGHSVFANVLLQSLSEDQEAEFTAGQLFNRIQELVGVRATHVPQYKLILDPRSDVGDFVFFQVQGHHANVPDHPVEAQTDPQTVFERIVRSEQEAIFAALDTYAKAFSSIDIQKLKRRTPISRLYDLNGLSCGTIGPLISR